jgi:predicted ATPase
VLDNCERLLDDVARTAGRILASCPSVTVLATSRRTIGLGGERILELQPLAVADDRAVAQDGWSALLASPAGKLFVDRSEAAGTRWRRSRDDAAAIATLCRRLDGLPLALELAAARTRSMALTDMIDHLTERFRLVSSLGADSRTASLHEALQSSRELLTETEARTFDALSVFAGAFDLAAADAVVRHVVPGDETAFELLGQLVDHSLLTVTPAPRRRFRMLESVREFANEHLRSTGDLDAVVSAHTAYYSKLVEEAWARRRTLDGDVDLRARLEDSQQEILTVIERMRAGGDRCGAQRVAGAMGPYWSMKWFTERGLHACDAIGDACPNQDPAILARFLWTWSAMHALMGNADTSAVLAERTHRAALEAGDWALAADALIVAPEWPFFPSFQTDPESWSPVFALYRRADDALGEAWAYDCRGWSAAWSGRYLDARQDFRRAAELFESVDDQHGIASARLGLTASCRLLGDLDAARRQLERASESACRTSSTHVLAEIEWEDAELARAEGDADRAVEGYARALALLEERSPGTVATNALRTMLGWVLRESGRRRDALEVMLDALRFCVRSDVESRWKHGTFVLESLAGLCAEAFDACIAATLYGAAHAARLEAARPMPEWDVARFERDVALLRRRLVSDEFDRCWRAGSELTPEAAARAAISDLTPILADAGPVTTS